jgi:hypothetical protein
MKRVRSGEPRSWSSIVGRGREDISLFSVPSGPAAGRSEPST